MLMATQSLEDFDDQLGNAEYEGNSEDDLYIDTEDDDEDDEEDADVDELNDELDDLADEMDVFAEYDIMDEEMDSSEPEASDDEEDNDAADKTEEPSAAADRRRRTEHNDHVYLRPVVRLAETDTDSDSAAVDSDSDAETPVAVTKRELAGTFFERVSPTSCRCQLCLIEYSQHRSKGYVNLLVAHLCRKHEEVVTEYRGGRVRL